MPPSARNIRAIIAGVLTILFWASAYPAIRVGLRDFTPGQLAAMRFLTASIFFAVYVGFRRDRIPRGADLVRVSIAGALGITAYNLLLNTGELTVSAGAASLIINCMPVFAAILSVVFLGERLRAIGWLGIAVSFLGVSIIALRDPQGLHFGLGAVLIVGAALCSAVMGLLQKPLLTHYSSASITASIMWSGALLLAPFLPGAFRVTAHGAVTATLCAVYLGIFPAALGYLTWALVLSRFSLSQTASMLYLIPIAAVVISFFWIGEIPSSSSVMGGLLAIVGVVLLTRYGKRRPVPSVAVESRLSSEQG